MSIDASIVITTQQSNHNEWMAFASWYSVHRNLPDCTVAVVFPRSFKHHQFTWLNKCHVPYLAYPAEATAEQAIETLLENRVISEPVIVLKDHHMVIGEMEDKVEGIVAAESLSCYANCASDKLAHFVDYQNCGKFMMEEWLQTEQRHPFYRTAQLMGRQRTLNEQRVFQLWRQMGTTFDFLNRG